MEEEEESHGELITSLLPSNFQNCLKLKVQQRHDVHIYEYDIVWYLNKVNLVILIVLLCC